MEKCIEPQKVHLNKLAHNKKELSAKVHEIINRFADRGLRSLGVGKQVSSINNR
jgi:hypothetical protein